MSAQWEWISGRTDCAPVDCGFDPSRLTNLEGIFAVLVRQGKAQCAAYSLSRHGRVFANRSLGPRRFDSDAPMESGTWRKIASITKVLTALGVLKLVEDGRLMMEMPLCHVLPEFGNATHSGIRLFDVLTHTSGLAADPGYNCEPDADHAGFWAAFDAADWIAARAAIPLDHATGAKWSYCTTGFALLGEVIARITGEPYYRWLEREILVPAGMRDTFWDPGDRPKSGFALVSKSEESLLSQRGASLGRPILAGTGAFSTCPDLLRLARLFLDDGMADGRRILGKSTLAAMRSLHVQVPAFHWGDRFADWRYGLALEPARHPLIVPGSVWGHEGAGRCAWWFAPAEDFAAAWTLPTTVDWDPDFCWTPRAVILSGLG